jgi:hypothetical protein
LFKIKAKTLWTLISNSNSLSNFSKVKCLIILSVQTRQSLNNKSNKKCLHFWTIYSKSRSMQISQILYSILKQIIAFKQLGVFLNQEK